MEVGLVEMTTRAGKAGGNLMVGLLLLFAHCTLDYYFSIIQFKQNVRIISTLFLLGEGLARVAVSLLAPHKLAHTATA